MITNYGGESVDLTYCVKCKQVVEGKPKVVTGGVKHRGRCPKSSPYPPKRGHQSVPPAIRVAELL